MVRTFDDDFREMLMTQRNTSVGAAERGVPLSSSTEPAEEAVSALRASIGNAEPVMDGLITRLEKATGPDRTLDAAIAQSIGAEHGRREFVHEESRSYEVHDEIAPHYTRSLDAAARLVPEGHQVADLTDRDPTLGASWASAKVRPHRTNDDAWDRGGIHYGSARTLPLAICIAALKARASAPNAPQPQTTPLGVALKPRWRWWRRRSA